MTVVDDEHDALAPGRLRRRRTSRRARGRSRPGRPRRGRSARRPAGTPAPGSTDRPRARRTVPAQSTNSSRRRPPRTVTRWTGSASSSSLATVAPASGWPSGRSGSSASPKPAAVSRSMSCRRRCSLDLDRHVPDRQCERRRPGDASQPSPPRDRLEDRQGQAPGARAVLAHDEPVRSTETTVDLVELAGDRRAEDRMGLRGGQEVAGPTRSLDLGAVVAEPRLVQGERHEPGERDRTVPGDLGPDPVDQDRLALDRQRRRIRQRSQAGLDGVHRVSLPAGRAGCRARPGCVRRAGPGSGPRRPPQSGPTARGPGRTPGRAGRTRNRDSAGGQRASSAPSRSAISTRLSTMAPSPSSASRAPSASGPSRSRTIPRTDRGARSRTAAGRPVASRLEARSPRSSTRTRTRQRARRSSQPIVDAEVRPATTSSAPGSFRTPRIARNLDASRSTASGSGKGRIGLGPPSAVRRRGSRRGASRDRRRAASAYAGRPVRRRRPPRASGAGRCRSAAPAARRRGWRPPHPDSATTSAE